MPKRIQISRKKGARMDPRARKVDRSTVFGNPFILMEGLPREEAQALAVEAFRRWLEHPKPDYAPGRHAIIRSRLNELRGQDLACWCRLDQPCHADVLLEFANR